MGNWIHELFGPPTNSVFFPANISGVLEELIMNKWVIPNDDYTATLTDPRDGWIQIFQLQEYPENKSTKTWGID